MAVSFNRRRDKSILPLPDRDARRDLPHAPGGRAETRLTFRRYLPSTMLERVPMPEKKRLYLCGCVGLAVASFALIGAIVAQPVLSTLWQSPITSAQLGKSPQLD